jgi:hypothetical protein
MKRFTPIQVPAVLPADTAKKAATATWGRYPEALARILTVDDLYGKSKAGLRTMHNEIFARLGYIFNPPVNQSITNKKKPRLQTGAGV